MKVYYGKYFGRAEPPPQQSMAGGSGSATDSTANSGTTAAAASSSASGGGRPFHPTAALESENKSLRTEVIRLQQQNQLLAVRTDSLQRVVELQETDLQRMHNTAAGVGGSAAAGTAAPSTAAGGAAGMSAGSGSGSGSGTDSPAPLMLWRQKVFELMVQLKSSELTVQKELTEDQNEIERLTAAIDKQNRAVRMHLWIPCVLWFHFSSYLHVCGAGGGGGIALIRPN